MADVENQQEPPLPVKRKPDLYCQDQDNVANKAQKLQPADSAAPESKDGENGGNLDSAEEKAEIEAEPVISPEKSDGSAAERDEVSGDLGEEADGEEEEEARREAEVDRKGKGIMRDDKGKGKLIEVDDSDEDDGDDDGDVGSDLSDDPLAEVDLDNILPSRTRRRAMQPGLYISEEIANHDDDDDDEDDDEDEDDDDDDDDDDEDDGDSEDSEASM